MLNEASRDERGTIVWESGALSDKPVAKRLQVKGDRRLAVIGASLALEKTVGGGKARADVARADVVLLFRAGSRAPRRRTAGCAQYDAAIGHPLGRLSQIVVEIGRGPPTKGPGS
jgi:hypothetical protein